MLAGAVRLTELTGGAAVTERNARFFDSPAPVIIHIVSVTVYALLGAFQFVPALRPEPLAPARRADTPACRSARRTLGTMDGRLLRAAGQ